MKTTTRQSKWIRLLSMALSISLLTGVQGFNVLAEAVSENAVTKEAQDSQKNDDTEDKTLKNNEVTGDGSIEDNTDIDRMPAAESDGMENILSGAENEEVLQAGTGSPANPVHHCTKQDDGTDTTQWSFVYFGSYPQSEVTDPDIIADIESTISANCLTNSGEGIDVWVNGTRYRRISKDDTNSDKYFDKVKNNGYRYFKWERIKWRVLQNDGETLFVVADQALDCKAYNEEKTSVTWEQCTLRSWLNDSFYNTAFSVREQGAIMQPTVVNRDNPLNGMESGNDAADKIYLLSMEEATNRVYGFCNDRYTESAGRKTGKSEFAFARGAGAAAPDNCYLWLCCPGPSTYAANVTSPGAIASVGSPVNDSHAGICPALYINLSSNFWSMEDDGTSGDGGEEKSLIKLKAEKAKTVYIQGEELNVDDLQVTAYYNHPVHGNTEKLLTEGYSTNAEELDMNTSGNKILGISYRENGVEKTTELTVTVNPKPDGGQPANPVYHCPEENDGTDTTDWSYVYFGSYPQSEVTDSDIITAVDNAISANNLTSSISANDSTGSGEGTDVWVNGTKYRRISISDTSHDEYWGEETNNGYRYFKWERIKWRVLQNDGETLFVVADQALDCKDYNENGGSIIWKDCALKSWLNSSFYNTAFSSQEQSAIAPQNVAGKDNPDNETEGGNDTNDKVYLLSREEAASEIYGFCSDADTESASRWMQVSPYAGARGVNICNDDNTGGNDNCRWWLRSFGIDTDYVVDVSVDGHVEQSGGNVSDRDVGVCPALYINLSSTLWFMEDDGTSGHGGEEKSLTKLKAEKTKTVYMQGEKLNVDDLQVTACYKYSVYGNAEELLTEGYTTNAEELDMSTSGNKTLRISYTENGVTKTAELTITVNSKLDDGKSKPEGENQKTDGGQNQPDGSQNQQVRVKKLTITAPSKKLAAGKRVKLAVNVTPTNVSNKAVIWKTSNKKYATINKNGKLTLKKAGIGKTVTITATAKDGSGKKAKIKIKIMKHAVKNIKLTAPAKTLKAGKSMIMKAAVKTTGRKVNKTLTWKSSNTKYAMVNKKGKVTAKKAGKGKTVTITAASTDGSNKKAKVRIKIN